jgi:hypothetical protein
MFAVLLNTNDNNGDFYVSETKEQDIKFFIKNQETKEKKVSNDIR